MLGLESSDDGSLRREAVGRTTEVTADIELIVSSLRANLPLAARHLVQAANDNGGLDNVSVILVKVEDAAPAVAHKGWADRLFGWMR